MKMSTYTTERMLDILNTTETTMKVDQQRSTRKLEEEIRRLKLQIAELSANNRALRETILSCW